MTDNLTVKSQSSFHRTAVILSILEGKISILRENKDEQVHVFLKRFYRDKTVYKFSIINPYLH